MRETVLEPSLTTQRLFAPNAMSRGRLPTLIARTEDALAAACAGKSGAGA